MIFHKGAELFWELYYIFLFGNHSFFYGFNWRWRRFTDPAKEVGLWEKQLEGAGQKGGRASVIRLRFVEFRGPCVHKCLSVRRKTSCALRFICFWLFLCLVFINVLGPWAYIFFGALGSLGPEVHIIFGALGSLRIRCCAHKTCRFLQFREFWGFRLIKVLALRFIFLLPLCEYNMFVLPKTFGVSRSRA